MSDQTPVQAAPELEIRGSLPLEPGLAGICWSQALQCSDSLEMNAFHNDIITVLVLIFYCLLSPLYEADPAAHISDLDGLQPFFSSLGWLYQAHATAVC